MAEKEQILTKPIKSLLISQPEPADRLHSPFAPLVEKFGVELNFKQFIKVQCVNVKDFRRNRLELSEYTAVYLGTKIAVENFFHLCEEVRFKVSEDLKYFCTNEQVALYLQRFIHYRKRKVFHGMHNFADTKDVLLKHKKKEKFLVTLTNANNPEVPDFFKNNGFNYSEAVITETVSADIKDSININNYDMLIFFTPFGVRALFENFPDFVQGDTKVACCHEAAEQVAIELGLRVDVHAAPEGTSVIAQINAYLQTTNAITI
jgi:uroporphyrinogen-III synthase